MDAGDPDVLVAGLRAVLETPLGPLADDPRLCDLRRADRLDELTFELPLAGGDRPRGEVTPAAIAGVPARHLDAGDPLAAYAQRLGDPALRHAVRGYLTGSVDLLLRATPGGGAALRDRDYKTNRLGGPDEALTAWHHRPAALAARCSARTTSCRRCSTPSPCTASCAGGWPATTPTATSPESCTSSCADDRRRDADGDGVPCGVFSWRPPRAVLELSDLFDRGVTA